MQAQTNQQNFILASFICLLAATFYLYDFVVQVSPSVMTYKLMHAFALNSTGLGLLSAVYFVGYTPMQLPAGYLYDRLGPRILMAIAVLVTAIGVILFAISHTIVIAAIGRILMGMGSAFAFIGTLVLISRWFPPQYFAFLAGITQLMSSIGAIFGETPLAWLVHGFGWRHSMIGVGIFGLLLSSTIFLFVRNQPEGYKVKDGNYNTTLPKSQSRLYLVLTNSQNLYTAFYAFCVWAPVVIFAALWGGTFLREAYFSSDQGAATAIAMIWLGIGVGSPLFGWLSEKYANRKSLLIFCALIGLIATTCVLYIHHLSLFDLYLSLFLMGIAASGQSLSFGVIKDNNYPSQVGTAVGFNNMAIVAGGMLFQPLVGYLLDKQWSGVVLNNTPYYSVHDFRISLFILPLCYLICLFVSIKFIKETHCQPTYLTDSNIAETVESEKIAFNKN